MRALDIDVETRTAWAETGLTAGDYTTAAAAHGLATGFGDTGSVGIGGSRWVVASASSSASTGSRSTICSRPTS